MIRDDGKAGSPSRAPTSMVSGGASRHENAATARPAETAAITAACPPPTKTSFHSMPAANNEQAAMSRTPQQGANAASRNPMLVLSVFRVRRFSGALLGSMGMNFSFWPLIIYLPVYFHSVLGYYGLQTGLALTAYTLPTLFAPPWAERLALRWPSGRVISLGLALIALGLGLMAAGTTLPVPEWLLLPGCVIAGLGVGMSNTTASNTITGAVPPERAGMASGADTSARMISLALNIALMGLILVEGIMAALRRTSGATTGIELRLMAEKLATGDAAVTPDRAALLQGAADPSAILHLALGTGFTWIMVYGATSALILALCSTWILTPARRPQPCPAACIQQGA